MDPMTLYLLFSAGSGLLGGIMNGNAQNKQTQLNATQFEEQRQDEQRQLLAQFLQGVYGAENQDRQFSAAQGLNATQLDPYKHAKDLNSANVRRSFAAGYDPARGGFSGDFDMSALSPENLTKSSDNFYRNVAAAQPNVPLNGESPSAEEFRNSYMNDVNKRKSDLTNLISQYLSKIGTPPPGPAAIQTQNGQPCPAGTHYDATKIKCQLDTGSATNV